MSKDIGFNRQVGEISIIIDKEGNAILSSVNKDSVELILSLDKDNPRFLALQNPEGITTNSSTREDV